MSVSRTNRDQNSTIHSPSFKGIALFMFIIVPPALLSSGKPLGPSSERNISSQLKIALERNKFIAHAQSAVASQTKWREFAHQLENDYRQTTQKLVSILYLFYLSIVLYLAKTIIQLISFLGTEQSKRRGSFISSPGGQKYLFCREYAHTTAQNKRDTSGVGHVLGTLQRK